MVLIVDGRWKKNMSFLLKKNIFVMALGLNKCLKRFIINLFSFTFFCHIASLIRSSSVIYDKSICFSEKPS